MALERPDASQEFSARTWLRRPLLGALIGLVAGIRTLHDSAAKKKKKKKVKLCLNGQTISVRKKKKRSYVRQGATPGVCSSIPCVASCTGKPCGVDDGCGGTCECPAGQVCDGGTCHACTIQCDGTPTECGTALEGVAGAGGNVYVCPGRYRGFFWLVHNIRLIGAGQGDNPATSTILEGGVQGRVMAVDLDVTATIENVRITRGYQEDGRGGGIGNGGSLSMRRCTVTDNRATGARSGCGVLQFEGATGPVALTDCTITNNHCGQHGGGVAQFDPSYPVTLTNCVVSGNTAGNSGVGSGGGVFSLDGEVSIVGGSVTNNWAITGGGILGTSGANVAVAGVTISGNQPTNCVNVTGCSA